MKQPIKKSASKAVELKKKQQLKTVSSFIKEVLKNCKAGKAMSLTALALKHKVDKIYVTVLIENALVFEIGKVGKLKIYKYFPMGDFTSEALLELIKEKRKSKKVLQSPLKEKDKNQTIDIIPDVLIETSPSEINNFRFKDPNNDPQDIIKNVEDFDEKVEDDLIGKKVEIQNIQNINESVDNEKSSLSPSQLELSKLSDEEADLEAKQLLDITKEINSTIDFNIHLSNFYNREYLEQENLRKINQEITTAIIDNRKEDLLKNSKYLLNVYNEMCKHSKQSDEIYRLETVLNIDNARKEIDRLNLKLVNYMQENLKVIEKNQTISHKLERKRSIKERLKYLFTNKLN